MSLRYCGGKSPRYGFRCVSPTVFGVGLVGAPVEEWRAACAQHLAQVVRAQLERLKPDPLAVTVAPVTRTAPPPTT